VKKKKAKALLEEGRKLRDAVDRRVATMRASNVRLAEERDRAWNEAIEAAALAADEDLLAGDGRVAAVERFDGGWSEVATLRIARRIRALGKGKP
jgi:hypothetical protein